MRSKWSSNTQVHDKESRASCLSLNRSVQSSNDFSLWEKGKLETASEPRYHGCRLHRRLPQLSLSSSVGAAELRDCIVTQ